MVSILGEIFSRTGCQFGVPGDTYPPQQYPSAPPPPGYGAILLLNSTDPSFKVQKTINSIRGVHFYQTSWKSKQPSRGIRRSWMPRYEDSELSSNLTFVRNRKLQLFNLGPSQSHSVFYISFIWFPPPSTKAILISCYFGLILFTLDTFLNSPLWVFEMVHTARNRPIFVYYNYFLISIALAFSNQVKETPILNIERI